MDGSPERFLRLAKLYRADFSGPLACGQLRIYQINSLLIQARPLHTANLLVEAFESYIGSGNQLVIFEESFTCLGLRFPNSVELTLATYRRYAQRADVPLLFLIDGKRPEPTFRTALHRLHLDVDGYARIVQGVGNFQFAVDHWTGPEGISGCETLNLSIVNRNELQVISPPSRLPGKPTPVQVLIHATSAALCSERGNLRISSPVILLDHYSALSDLPNDHVLRLVLLHFEPSSFESLVQALLRLDNTQRRRLKILLREILLPLRLHQRAILRRLGVAGVIPIGTSNATVAVELEALGAETDQWGMNILADANPAIEYFKALLPKLENSSPNFASLEELFQVTAVLEWLHAPSLLLTFPCADNFDMAALVKSLRANCRDLWICKFDQTLLMLFIACDSAKGLKIVNRPEIGSALPVTRNLAMAETLEDMCAELRKLTLTVDQVEDVFTKVA